MDGMRREYEIQLPMEMDANRWFTVCRAITSEGAAEVVRVLLNNGVEPGTHVRIAVNLKVCEKGDK
jgi:hypothetical protein